MAHRPSPYMVWKAPKRHYGSSSQSESYKLCHLCAQSAFTIFDYTRLLRNELITFTRSVRTLQIRNKYYFLYVPKYTFIRYEFQQIFVFYDFY